MLAESQVGHLVADALVPGFPDVGGFLSYRIADALPFLGKDGLPADLLFEFFFFDNAALVNFIPHAAADPAGKNGILPKREGDAH